MLIKFLLTCQIRLIKKKTNYSKVFFLVFLSNNSFKEVNDLAKFLFLNLLSFVISLPNQIGGINFFASSSLGNSTSIVKRWE